MAHPGAPGLAQSVTRRYSWRPSRSRTTTPGSMSASRASSAVPVRPWPRARRPRRSSSWTRASRSGLRSTHNVNSCGSRVPAHGYPKRSRAAASRPAIAPSEAVPESDQTSAVVAPGAVLLLPRLVAGGGTVVGGRGLLASVVGAQAVRGRGLLALLDLPGPGVEVVAPALRRLGDLLGVVAGGVVDVSHHSS